MVSKESETTGNALVQALARARKNFGVIEKSAQNTFHKNQYATLDDVLNATVPALSAEGLEILGLGEVLEAGTQILKTTLVHHPTGNEVVSEFKIPDVGDPQKVGIWITYLRRYSVGALLNVLAEMDDDGNGAMIEQSKAPANKPAQNKPAQNKPAPKKSGEPGVDGYNKLLKDLKELVKENGADEILYPLQSMAGLDPTDKWTGMDHKEAYVLTSCLKSKEVQFGKDAQGNKTVEGLTQAIYDEFLDIFNQLP